MTMRHITLSVNTVIATQIGTATSTQHILGKLVAILYKPGTIDTAATITITTEGNFSHALLTVASPGTADILYYPRDLVHAVANGAALTGTAGGDRALPLVDGYLKIGVASGGGTTVRTGSIVAYYVL